MSTEIQRYQPVSSAVAERAPTEIDQWVLVVRDVSTLASQIADTEFVPQGMRGNPAAVAACILAGREAGIGPMSALQNIHLVKGKPGQSALLMRQLVLAAGHSIRFVETTDTRCIIEGRRRGEEQWERVTFTADQARRAKIDLGGYPEDKLVARASVRLCRRKFADCIGGMPYTIEELEDGDVPGFEVDVPTPAGEPPVANAQPAKRTAKRRTATKASAARDEPTDGGGPYTAADAKAAEEHAQANRVESPVDGPPLPGEDGYDDTDDPTEQAKGGDKPATRDQLNKLHAQLGELDITERADKLTTVGLLVKRNLTSSQDLTIAEASGVIDLLERLLASEAPSKALDTVLAQLEESDQNGGAP